MFYFFIFIIGLVVGSFLNVVIFRLKSGEKFGGRSHCPHCHRQLKAQDLLPVLSFIFYHGRCRYCQKKISWQYPIVELTTGFLFILGTYNIIGGLPASILLVSHQIFFLWLRNLVFFGFLLVIFVYDWRWYLILDKVTIPAMAVALIFNLFLGISWLNLLVAAAIGLGFFLVQYLISKGKWIGGGDLRLGLLMGLMLGWPKIILALFLAYIIGAVVGLILIKLNKKNLKSEIQFGTFLAVGTIITLLWGEVIVGWYLRI